MRDDTRTATSVLQQPAVRQHDDDDDNNDDVNAKRERLSATGTSTLTATSSTTSRTRVALRDAVLGADSDVDDEDDAQHDDNARVISCNGVFVVLRGLYAVSSADTSAIVTSTDTTPPKTTHANARFLRMVRRHAALLQAAGMR
jgi:hypothetical protein